MKKTLLCAERVLLGTGLEVMEQVCVLVDNGKIEKICPTAAMPVEEMEQYQVIDLGNRTLMPGLIECHNHLCIDARIPDHFTPLSRDTEAELTIIALKGLEDDLMSGVTTARCLGDKYYIDVTMKKLIQQGKVVGPNLLVAGIGMKGLHGHGFIGSSFTGPEALRLQARQNMQKGVDLLKIFVTPGTIPAGRAFIPSFLSPEEIRVVVEEGRRRNIKVAAHCVGGGGLKDCVENGVAVIEHMYGASDEDVKILKDSDCWVDLTSGIYVDPEREQYVQPDLVEKYRMCRGDVIESVSKIINCGIRFVLGTDANHGFLYKEAVFAVRYGADRKYAVQGVTSNAAEACGIAHRTGSLTTGLDADIIAVDGNPLEHVEDLKQVAFVMKGGKVYRK